VLLDLTTEGYITSKRICAIAARNDQMLNASTRSVKVFAYNLRRKLAKHHVQILTINRFGYGLRKEGREKICRLLAEYNAELTQGEKPMT
jgi:hypothetical protein